jgi:hypothetical protein
MASANVQNYSAGIAETQRNIERLQKETGRSMNDACSYAALKVAESGRSIAKPGKTRREVEKNPNYSKASANRRRWMAAFASRGETAEAAADLYPWYILRMRQGGLPPLRIGTDAPRKDPRGLIRDITTKYGKRGLGRASWSVMVGKLGAMKDGGTQSATLPVQNARTAPSEITKERTPRSVLYRLVNKLSYMQAAYPSIVGESLSRGNAALTFLINRAVARNVARANGNG